MAYTQAAVERAMKVHEVLMQALNGRQPWIQVAEVLGVSARTVRRLRWRYEKHGFTGLFDHRHHTPRPGRCRWRRSSGCLRSKGAGGDPRRNGEDYPMTRRSDRLGPHKNPNRASMASRRRKGFS